MLNSTQKYLIHKIKRRASSLFSSTDSKSFVHPKALLNRFTKIRNSSIGRYSYIGPRTKLDNANIGSFCSVSWDCHIGLASHPTHLVSTSPIFYEKHNGTGSSWLDSDALRSPIRETIVGHDVWIGANCTILEGVQIGHGAVIAAGSVVTKNVLPYSIVGGVPAKHIRFRFSEEVIAALLQKQWWNAPEEKIKSTINYFSIPNPTVDDISRLPDGKSEDAEDI